MTVLETVSRRASDSFTLLSLWYSRIVSVKNSQHFFLRNFVLLTLSPPLSFAYKYLELLHSIGGVTFLDSSNEANTLQ